MNDKSSPSRDFIGYADQPPSVVWPDEAQVAINFCINYEEGGELCISLTRRPLRSTRIRRGSQYTH